METIAPTDDLPARMEAACSRIGACYLRVLDASPVVRDAILCEHRYINALIRGFGKTQDSLKPLVALTEQSAALMEGCLANTPPSVRE